MPEQIPKALQVTLSEIEMELLAVGLNYIGAKLTGNLDLHLTGSQQILILIQEKGLREILKNLNVVTEKLAKGLDVPLCGDCGHFHEVHTTHGE